MKQAVEGARAEHGDENPYLQRKDDAEACASSSNTRDRTPDFHSYSNQRDQHHYCIIGFTFVETAFRSAFRGTVALKDCRQHMVSRDC
jgi:hypothetical protein